MPTSFEELCAQALVGLSIASPAQIQAAPAAEAPNFDGDERYSPDFPPDFDVIPEPHIRVLLLRYGKPRKSRKPRPKPPGKSPLGLLPAVLPPAPPASPPPPPPPRQGNHRTQTHILADNIIGELSCRTTRSSRRA